MADATLSSEREGRQPFKEKLAEVFIYGKSMVPALGVLLIILVALFGTSTPNFLTYTNFKAIISNIPIIAIMAVGMTFVILVGGLDISVGSVLGFTAVNVALFHHMGFPAWAIVLVCLGIGVIFGSFNAIIITRVGVNPVITTLGTMALARGMASWFALDIESLKLGRIFDQQFLLIARRYFPREAQLVPITLIYVIVLYIAMSLVLKYTRYGRRVYAVGSNEYAARLAGIDVARIKFSAYVMSGVMASLAGMILVAQLSLGRDDAGLGSELEVITAVVHLQETIGISYYWREVVKGAILILAISIDAARLMAVKKRQVVRQ
jgi:ribose/xylose/arabinose/galactoside ABC-type transport system permease subunit